MEREEGKRVALTQIKRTSYRKKERGKKLERERDGERERPRKRERKGGRRGRVLKKKDKDTVRNR